MRSKYGLYWVLLLIMIAVLAWQQFVRNPTPDNKNNNGQKDFARDTTRIIYSKHARCRMECRHIDESEIKDIISRGAINYSKSELKGKPDPKYALEGVTGDGQRVRIIVAKDEEALVIVTCIDLEREWSCNCE